MRLFLYMIAVPLIYGLIAGNLFFLPTLFVHLFKFATSSKKRSVALVGVLMFCLFFSIGVLRDQTFSGDMTFIIFGIALPVFLLAPPGALISYLRLMPVSKRNEEVVGFLQALSIVAGSALLIYVIGWFTGLLSPEDWIKPQTVNQLL